MGAGGLPNIIGATNPPPNPRKIGNKLNTDRRSNNDKIEESEAANHRNQPCSVPVIRTRVKECAQ